MIRNETMVFNGLNECATQEILIAEFERTARWRMAGYIRNKYAGTGNRIDRLWAYIIIQIGKQKDPHPQTCSSQAEKGTTMPAEHQLDGRLELVMEDCHRMRLADQRSC